MGWAAYDLLILADGPWTEARFRTAPSQVLAARRWVEYIRLLAEGATKDLDAVQEQIDDSAREMAARTHEQQKSLNRSRIARARIRLKKARDQQAELRQALLLDDEDPDVIS